MVRAHNYNTKGYIYLYPLYIDFSECVFLDENAENFNPEKIYIKITQSEKFKHLEEEQNFVCIEKPSSENLLEKQMQDYEHNWKSIKLDLSDLIINGIEGLSDNKGKINFSEYKTKMITIKKNNPTKQIVDNKSVITMVEDLKEKNIKTIINLDINNLNFFINSKHDQREIKIKPILVIGKETTNIYSSLRFQLTDTVMVSEIHLIKDPCSRTSQYNYIAEVNNDCYNFIEKFKPYF